MSKKQTVTLLQPDGVTPVTPTQQAVAAAQGGNEEIDAGGHTLVMRELDRLERIVFVRNMGEHTKNELWMQMATAAATVRSIDGKPYRVPISPKEAEEKFVLIGDEGQVVVEKWFQALIEKRQAEQADAADDAKN